MVLQKLQNIVADIKEINPEDITRKAYLDKDCGADKIDVQDIMMELEEYYDINIPDRKIGLMVGDLVKYIEANAAAELVVEKEVEVAVPLEKSA